MPRHFMHAESCLARSRALLADGKPESLIYASLEFRFAVEARLLEHSESAEEFVQYKGTKWKAKELRKHVQSVFGHPNAGGGAAVYTVEIHSELLPKPVTLRYTPVTEETVDIMGKLDNYLHALGASTVMESKHAERIRELLGKGITALAVSISGGMGGPLLRIPGSSFVKMSVDFEAHPDLAPLIGRESECTLRIEITPFEAIIKEIQERK